MMGGPRRPENELNRLFLIGGHTMARTGPRLLTSPARLAQLSPPERQLDHTMRAPCAPDIHADSVCELRFVILVRNCASYF